LVHDEHLRDRAVFVTASREDGPDFEQVGWTLAGADRTQPGPVVRPPGFTDTDAVLRAAGFGTEEIAALREEGAVA
jgi:crotonobetainyl-CoA:carnitine CoA-transferase CaiB-like acyl-CoA transferase